MRAKARTLAAVLACAVSSAALSQTYDPQSGQSPLVLLQAPADGVAWYRKLQKARELNSAEQWAEAEPLWETLVREYPRCAECWMLLGRSKLRLKKGDEAAAAYRRAGPLIGWDVQFANGYRAAAALVQAGRKQEAFDQLREMIFERHGFWRQQLAEDWAPYFDSVKDDPEFREITGWPDTSGWSREKGWRYDLDFLYSETKRVNPDYRSAFLRHNNGRSTPLYEELLRSLIAFSRAPDHTVYVLIGRRTYSATGNFVTGLERLVRPVFVGEPSSECCNLYGDPIMLTLPYSRTQLEVTALRWQLSVPSDRRREITPDVPVQLTAAAYFAGRDPALDAIFELIAAHP